MKKFLTRIGIMVCALVCSFSLVACGSSDSDPEEETPQQETVVATGITLSDTYQAIVHESGSSETYALTATISPETTTDKTVTWTSSNTDVATVSESGVVTAVANGEATITATIGTYSATCDILVGTGVSDAASLTFNDANTTTYYYILTQDISASSEIVVSSPAVIDLNEKTVSTSGTLTSSDSGRNSAGLFITKANGSVTIKNGNVTADGAAAIYAYNSLETNASNYNLTIENVNITTKYDGVRVYASTATLNNCTVSISTATSASQGACVFETKGSTVTINGGNFSSACNYVIATDGYSGCGGNTLSISNATITASYSNSNVSNPDTTNMACGVYVANSDTATISSTTINVTDGIGLLVRGGTTTVQSDVVINSTSTSSVTTGTVGSSSSSTLSAGYEIVIDKSSTQYPDYSNATVNNYSSYTPLTVTASA